MSARLPRRVLVAVLFAVSLLFGAEAASAQDQPCTPTTCEAQGKNCGQIGDGCGNTLNCGTCPEGQVCGGATPNVCQAVPTSPAEPTPTPPPPQPTCVPKKCADLGKNCDLMDDGCAGLIDCGKCTPPETCGGAGVANVCGQAPTPEPTPPPCVPKTCVELGKNCGQVDNGCGGQLNCGVCRPGETCDADNVCQAPPPPEPTPTPEPTPACVPTTCEAAGKNCGSISDGCGNTLNCGTCPAGQVCGAAAPGVCGAATPPPAPPPDLRVCKPKTCEDAKANCGVVADGCGGVLSCGTCTPPEVCGGSGEPNVCAPSCVPKTCAELGASCGPVDNGCGKLISCGSCPEGQVCDGNVCKETCVRKTCAELGFNCGLVPDGCGGRLLCGACAASQVCGADNVCKAVTPPPPPPPPTQTCTPTTCEAAGKNCGAIADGCGNIINCGKCPEGQVCGLTTPGVCGEAPPAPAAPTCTDGIRNGGEVDVDCGGSCPNKCRTGYQCNSAADCQTGKCLYGVCAAPPEVEPNDACTAGGDAPEIDELDALYYTGSIRREGDVDVYPFKVNRATGVTVKIKTFGVAYYDALCRQETDTVIELYKSDCGNLISSDDDGWVGYCSLIPSDKSALSAGTYFIKVRFNAARVRYFYTFRPFNYTLAVESFAHRISTGGVAPTCTPTTCLAQGKTCGQIGDGCGAMLNCGTCASPETCGGGGVANVCGVNCVPKTCAELGANCGTNGDGCGGTINCGTCTSPETCGGGGVPNVCGSSGCVPKTCQQLGKNCGTVDNGCGGTVDCGTCAAGQTCGGGGVANVCGGKTGIIIPAPAPAPKPAPKNCVPKTCTQLGVKCGQAKDGCGGVVNCGICRP